MLEGEIQAMYMCKPGKCVDAVWHVEGVMCVCLTAIERAMAYIDTGELPWDMDLFDRSSNSEVSAARRIVESARA